MNMIFEPLDAEAVSNTRNGFNTNYLTDPQYEMFVSICVMLNREIHRNCTFNELLEHMIFLASKTERYINHKTAEAIIRDVFRGVFGKTMDQLRTSLDKSFEELSDDQKSLGYQFAKATLAMIEEGDKIPFHRAWAHQAAILATELNIADIHAKQLMSEQFEAAEEGNFYEVGKQIEDKFYRPQIEAEKRERKAKRAFGRGSNYTNG